MSFADLRLALLPGLLVVALVGHSPLFAQETGYSNLKVLPADISREALGDVMLENLSALGLPRLLGEGCLTCHVGDLETPRSEWDYASDAKPMKAKARTMMAMVQSINREHLAKLGSRIAPGFEVTCSTCHAGRMDPRPLTDVLLDTYREGGISETLAEYQRLRERFFGGDAYDFRVHVLPGMALQLVDGGSIDDAIQLAEANVETFPDSATAQEFSVGLKVERSLDRHGIAVAIETFETLEQSLQAAALTADSTAESVAVNVLNSLAWRLIRTEREASGHRLIEYAHERFPQNYIALESAAFLLQIREQPMAAISLLESWLAKHPDHARARRTLANMERQMEAEDPSEE